MTKIKRGILPIKPQFILPIDQKRIWTKNVIQDQKENVYPTTDNLFIKWFYAFAQTTKQKVKFYTVVCRCGYNKLLKTERGLRCLLCGLFHSYETWNTMTAKVRRLTRFNDGLIEKLEQPKVK